MVARVVPVGPFDLVVFGGTRDLARRKLLPALYHRMKAQQMPQGARVIGAVRAQMSTDAYRATAREAIETSAPREDLDAAVLERFLGSLDYATVDERFDDGWPGLAAPAQDWSARAPATAEPADGREGLGRELFAAFRDAVGSAVDGAAMAV